METIFKVDPFVATVEVFDRSQIERRVPRAVAVDPDREIYLLSAENAILAKSR
jgi:hypothetical protein